MNLIVRVKLNLIGRHLFLQEKLGKLKSSNTIAASGQLLLPPRITATAIEAFLDCGWFARGGCKWILDRVGEAS